MQQCIFPCPRKSTLLSALKTLKTIYRRMLGYCRKSSYIYVVRLPKRQEFKFKKIKVMKQTKITEFIELIEEYKWEEAARMYYDWAYKHRDSFNRILNERNVKDKVINLLREMDEYGEHNDQI